MKLASARQRIFAYIIDSILLGVPAFVYFVYLYVQDPTLAISSTPTIGVLTVILANAYLILATYFLNGQTLGKKALKIKVIGLKETLTFVQIVLRYLVLYFIPYLFVQIVNFVFGPQTTLTEIATWSFFIAYIVVMFHNKDRQMLHDMVAKTRVVQVK